MDTIGKIKMNQFEMLPCLSSLNKNCLLEMLILFFKKKKKDDFLKPKIMCLEDL